jgi:hypothetical protein
MLKTLRQEISTALFHAHLNESPDMQLLLAKLQHYHPIVPLDHFAVIDLPGPNTGIPVMKDIFLALGYIERGQDYLAEKQNDFLWLTENDSAHAQAASVLPQVVVADFRLDEMPREVRDIIANYSTKAPTAPVAIIKEYCAQAATGNTKAAEAAKREVLTYFRGRNWPLPTTREFHTVHEFNELLAWVLVFGRKPNHFTISVHLLPSFPDIQSFAQFVQDETGLLLNHEEGKIKGGEQFGIAQGSTQGKLHTVTLADGNVELPAHFIEFVWRYPAHAKQKPIYWEDFFTGFIGKFANRVIESLYV